MTCNHCSGFTRSQLLRHGVAQAGSGIRAIEPGMPARELFHVARDLLDRDGYELLDLLGNIGHDLDRGGAVTGFIDPRNTTAMWGCWALEPHIGMDGIGAKVEDLVWIGEEGVRVVGA